MQALTDDQYARLLETELITLSAGTEQHQERLTIHKGFLALHSTYFADLLSQPAVKNENGDKVATEPISLHASVSAVKVFIRWCYERRLNSVDLATTERAVLITRKNILIDLWIFGERHQIPLLQNQAVDEFAALLVAHLNLVTAEDVRYIFGLTAATPTNALRNLVVMIVVVNVEVKKVPDEIRHFDQFAQAFPGFFTMMMKCSRKWLLFAGKSKANPEKLVEYFKKADMEEMFHEKVGKPAEWVQELCGMVTKKEVVPFEHREVIEIDDD